jgi:hypothetical protein
MVLVFGTIVVAMLFSSHYETFDGILDLCIFDFFFAGIEVYYLFSPAQLFKGMVWEEYRDQVTSGE